MKRRKRNKLNKQKGEIKMINFCGYGKGREKKKKKKEKERSRR